MWKYLIPLFALTMLSASALSAKLTHLEYLRAHTESDRHLMYPMVVESAGFKCSMVTHSFIRGTDKSGTVYITVRCKNGRDYLFMEGGSIEPGSARVLPCNLANTKMMKEISRLGCWDPIPLERS